MKKYRILSIIIVFILGCNQLKNKTEYYENGNIKKEIFYVNDSTLSICEYFTNGKINSSYNLVNNKK